MLCKRPSNQMRSYSSANGSGTCSATPTRRDDRGPAGGLLVRSLVGCAALAAGAAAGAGALIPSLIFPVFFFAVNIGTLQDFAQRGIPGLDYRAFQLPTAIIFAVTGVSRAHAVVTDIQSGYFDRMLMSPVRRLPLVVGMMAADFVQIIILSVPVILLGMLVGVRFETGPARSAPLSFDLRLLGTGVHRFLLRHGTEDRVGRHGQHHVHALSALRLPDHCHPSPGSVDRLDGDHRPLQPDDRICWPGYALSSTAVGSQRCSCRRQEPSCSSASSASGWRWPRCGGA